MRQLVLIGPPGAGKGTIAENIAAAYGVAHLSTGDILREAIAEETPLGVRAAEYVEAGRLVPQEILGEAVAEKLRGEGRFVLDGYPRTVEQAEFLAGLPEVELDAVLYVAVPETEAVRRLSGRLVCSACGRVTNAKGAGSGKCDVCGEGELIPRDDDRPETVKDRHVVYARETAPVIEYYRDAGLLREIDGTGDRDEVWARVEEALGAPAAGDDDNG